MYFGENARIYHLNKSEIKKPNFILSWKTHTLGETLWYSEGKALEVGV